MSNISVKGRALLAAVVVAVSACGGSSPETDGLQGIENPDPDTFGAQVASYEPVVGAPDRLLVGLVAGTGEIVGFGSVRFDLAYGGTRDEPLDEAVVELSAEAGYQLVAGQPAPQDTSGPRLMAPSDGLGVYGTDVQFDRPGFWVVRVVAVVDGDEIEAAATFEVFESPRNPFPGEAAPRTDNRMPGDPSVDPKAIDSRAAPDGSIPDPELHALTVADAIDLKRPTMIVVSTPVYCISRFCGPITDTVQSLANEFGDQMSFIHIEVWNDFEGHALNREAAEWIYQDGEDAKEPWVFLIGADGKVLRRWGNVVTDTELTEAVASVLG